MNIEISRVTKEEQIQFVAENFEKTISLWEDYTKSYIYEKEI
jgi:hypothetical protein